MLKLLTNSGFSTFITSNATNREYTKIGNYLYKRIKGTLQIYKTIYSGFSGYIIGACDPMAGSDEENNCYAVSDKADLEFGSCYDSDG